MQSIRASEGLANIHTLLLGMIPILADTERKEYFNLHYWRFAETLKECTHWTNGRVLDLGIVPGHMAVALRRLGCEVHGITDHEPSGQGRYGRADLSARWAQEGISLHYAIIDRESLPVMSDFFDGVLFTEVLEHLVFDPTPLVREIYRTLKPNGEVVVSTPNVARVENRIKSVIGRNVYPCIEEFYVPNPYMRHNREYTLQEVIDLFCPPFQVKTARYIAPYDRVVVSSHGGQVYDKREYDEIGGRFRTSSGISPVAAARQLLRLVKLVYPPLRSCLLVSFIAAK